MSQELVVATFQSDKDPNPLLVILPPVHLNPHAYAILVLLRIPIIHIIFANSVYADMFRFDTRHILPQLISTYVVFAIDSSRLDTCKYNI